MDPAALAGALRLFGLVLLATALLLCLDRHPSGRVRAMVVAGGAMLVIGSAYGVIDLVASLAMRLDRPFLALLIEYLPGTRFGRLTLIEIGAAVAAASLLLMPWTKVGRSRIAAPWVIASLLLCIPLAMAAKGHAGTAAMPVLTVSLQTLHVSAGIGWCALVFSALAPGREPFVARLRRISGKALAVVLVLIVSGVWAAWLHGLRPGNIFHSSYGLLVLLKAGLLALALVAAGTNRLAIRQDAPLPHSVGKRTWHTLLAESLVLAGILLAAAALAQSNPPH